MQNEKTSAINPLSPVSYSRYGRVGVIRIDNPPVNALGQGVRQGLLDALGDALSDDGAAVVVLLACGQTFIAGADIREFGKPPEAPLLPEVVAALEASSKPLIAVLHGTALGGGLEVALGCHLRIALRGTRVGLPEVKLGLLPGAGGTQRLPRLVGIECALDMVTSGRFVTDDAAKASGIVDDVVPGADPLVAGLAAAEKVLQGEYIPRRTGELPAPAADAQACQRYRAALNQDVPYLFSPFRCVDAVEASFQLPFAEGLKRERELFLACMGSPQRAGMIHAFFSARSAHKVPGADDARSLHTLGLIGRHGLFDVLLANAAKVGLRLVHLDTQVCADIQACLIAPDVDQERRAAIMAALPSATPCIDVVMPGEECAAVDTGAAALVLSPRGASLPICELLDRGDNPALIQGLANTLRQLRRQVVVTRGKSVIATLHEALTGTLAAGTTEACQTLAAWRAEGWDLSGWLPDEAGNDTAQGDAELQRAPLDFVWQQAARGLVNAGHVHRSSDIDVLAIEAFGYPRHFGGPDFRGQAF